MPHGDALKAYRKTRVETADNLELVVMCYEAAIGDLQAARNFHEQRDMEAAYARIRHAQDIITELLVGLDHERGGEIARNLSRLYNFMLRRLIRINSRQDISMYDQVIHILSELKDAWGQVRQNAAQASPPGGAPAGRGWEASA